MRRGFKKFQPLKYEIKEDEPENVTQSGGGEERLKKRERVQRPGNQEKQILWGSRRWEWTMPGISGYSFAKCPEQVTAGKPGSEDFRALNQGKELSMYSSLFYWHLPCEEGTVTTMIVQMVKRRFGKVENLVQSLTVSSRCRMQTLVWKVPGTALYSSAMKSKNVKELVNLLSDAGRKAEWQ